MTNKLPSKNFLREQVTTALQKYFENLEDGSIHDLYALVLGEVEAPLLEIVMQYAEGNQSKAATWLGISRGTLRKMLTKYHLAFS